MQGEEMSFRTAYHSLGRGRSGPLPLIRDGSPSGFGKSAKEESWSAYEERMAREERERAEYFKKVARLMQEERA
jgi:hypothetical protein